MIPANVNLLMHADGLADTAEPVLDIVPNAAGAWSVRRLASTSTSPFIAAAANIVSSSTNWAKTWNAQYTSGGDVDVSQLTTEIGILNSSGIRTWNDQSGNGRNATRGDTRADRHPLFYSNGFSYTNGRLSPYYLAGSTRFLSFSSITLASEFSIFVVEDRETTATVGALVGAITTTPTTLNSGVEVRSDGNIYGLSSNGFLTVANTSTLSRVLEYSISAGTRELRENGTLLSGTQSASTRNNVITHIGHTISGGVTRYTTGRIVEVIIYNRALTADERLFVTDNIRTYYGV